jgi:hypothetical protein
MSGKNFKLLRKGARKFRLPYKNLKKSYKKLAKEKKERFLFEARMSV